MFVEISMEMWLSVRDFTLEHRRMLLAWLKKQDRREKRRQLKALVEIKQLVQ